MLEIVLTAVLCSATTVAAVWVLWHRVLLPGVEQRARVVLAEVTDDAEIRLQALGDELAVNFRAAVRDGIRDAVLTPPTASDLTAGARVVTRSGVSVFEEGLRRVFGITARDPDAPRGTRPPEGG